MSFDSVFNGDPTTPNVSASGEAAFGIDLATGQLYYRNPQDSTVAGWQECAAPSATTSPIKPVSTTYSATNSDGTILCNGTFVMTLASTGVPTGKTFRLKNINTGTITVSSSVNIDFSTTYVLNSVGQSVDVQWDGTQWWVL